MTAAGEDGWILDRNTSNLISVIATAATFDLRGGDGSRVEEAAVTDGSEETRSDYSCSSA